MNIKTKLFIVGILALFGGFININTVSAQVISTTCNSAVISDFVTLQNGMTTNVWFEWGPTQYFGNSTPLQILFSNSNYSQMITGLSDNTTYYYRVVMNSGIGANTTGYTRSFRTPLCYSTVPFGNLSVRTSEATNIGTDSAILNGFVLANNDIYTNGYFEYGTTQLLGNTTSSRNLGGIQSNPFQENLANLTPGTVYYFRAVLSNQYAVSKGNILSFRTSVPITYVNANIKSNTVNKNKVVTAVASTKNTPKNSEEAIQIQQGALSFMFGGEDFLPNTLLGWLLLILLASLIIFAVRKAYYGQGVIPILESTSKKHN